MPPNAYCGIVFNGVSEVVLYDDENLYADVFDITMASLLNPDFSFIAYRNNGADRNEVVVDDIYMDGNTYHQEDMLFSKLVLKRNVAGKFTLFIDAISIFATDGTLISNPTPTNGNNTVVTMY